MAQYIDSEIKAEWKAFLDENYSLEIQRIVDIYPDEKSLVVDFEKIVEFDSLFAEDLIENAERYLEIGNDILMDLAQGEAKINLRIKNLSGCDKKVNDITSDDIGKLMKIDATVRKVSAPRPLITVAAWRCSDCGGITHVIADGGVLTKPKKCTICGKKRPIVDFTLEPGLSEKIDFQIIEIQDNPENLSAAQQPRRLEVHLFDDLAKNLVNPGDKVTIIGILKALPRKRGNRQLAQMDFYLHAVYLEKQNKDWSSIEINNSDIEKIKELSRRKDIMELFKESIAPTIWGHDKIKEALVLQLFGGVQKTIDSTKKRGDIHILLVGDPGTAKSEILMRIATIAPRAIYTSGKGSSAAGLTAAAVKDKDNVWTLEAGALVIADKGLACIDEIDKMSSEDRGAIHTAMEQQVVAIDKAGIHVILPTRTSILAAANPKFGRFDTNRSLSSQIDLDPPLLTRFDAIFKIVDEPNKDRDRALGKHLITLHSIESDEFKPPIDIDLLRKYIVYAKRIRPKLSDSAAKYLLNKYVNMRNRQNEGGAVSATPRQLEAMIRFAEASARLRLSDIVTKEDAERAAEIVEYYLKDVASYEGIIDIDVLYGSDSKTREYANRILEFIREREKVDISEIYREFGKEMKYDKIEQILDYLKREGDIYITRNLVMIVEG